MLLFNILLILFTFQGALIIVLLLVTQSIPARLVATLVGRHLLNSEVRKLRREAPRKFRIRESAATNVAPAPASHPRQVSRAPSSAFSVIDARESLLLRSRCHTLDGTLRCHLSAPARRCVLHSRPHRRCRKPLSNRKAPVFCPTLGP